MLAGPPIRSETQSSLMIDDAVDNRLGAKIVNYKERNSFWRFKRFLKFSACSAISVEAIHKTWDLWDMKFQVCYRCGRLIQWVQGYVSKNGKLIPLDYPSGEPHKHVFAAEAAQ